MTARRYFPQIWFDRATTEAGCDALGWYHEKQDKARGIGLGPEHDWSSHAADAFGSGHSLPSRRAAPSKSDLAKSARPWALP